MKKRLSGPWRLDFESCLFLALLLPLSNAAPLQESTEISEISTSGCYYNYNHYSEGDRILTNEPCLNCTCHNEMLMCYLRVCPFMKPVDQDCTIEKREDQCCPIITCPEVPVKIDHSTNVQSTALAAADRFGCSIDNKFYPEGAQLPSNPKKPCELCYCIRNMTSCVMQECTLHIDGCNPIYNKGVCCPTRYECGHEYDVPQIEDHSTTTVRPTEGYILTTTESYTRSCLHNGEPVMDGIRIQTDEPCAHCYCMRGDIVCAVQECSIPMEYQGKNCTPKAKLPNQCCPKEYNCEDATTELPTSPESSTIVSEEAIQPVTELTDMEPLMKTSSEKASESTDRLPVDSTTIAEDEHVPEDADHLNEIHEDVLATGKPDQKEKVEKTGTTSPFMTTTEFYISKYDEELQQHIDKHIPVVEDDKHASKYPEKIGTQTTMKSSAQEEKTEMYPTTLASEVKVKEPGKPEEEKVQSSSTVLPPATSSTEAPSSESPTTALLDERFGDEIDRIHTTTSGIAEEDMDVNTIISSVIPGEGDCLVGRLSYANNEQVPVTNKCEASCMCINSVVHCEPIKCAPAPSNAVNCAPIFDEQKSCCPTYDCEGVDNATKYAAEEHRETTAAMVDIAETTAKPIESDEMGATKIPSVEDERKEATTGLSTLPETVTKGKDVKSEDSGFTEPSVKEASTLVPHEMTTSRISEEERKTTVATEEKVPEASIPLTERPEKEKIPEASIPLTERPEKEKIPEANIPLTERPEEEKVSEASIPSTERPEEKEQSTVRSHEEPTTDEKPKHQDEHEPEKTSEHPEIELSSTVMHFLDHVEESTRPDIETADMVTEKDMPHRMTTTKVPEVQTSYLPPGQKPTIASTEQSATTLRDILMGTTTQKYLIEKVKEPSVESIPKEVFEISTKEPEIQETPVSATEKTSGLVTKESAEPTKEGIESVTKLPSELSTESGKPFEPVTSAESATESVPEMTHKLETQLPLETASKSTTELVEIVTPSKIEESATDSVKESMTESDVLSVTKSTESSEVTKPDYELSTEPGKKDIESGLSTEAGIESATDLPKELTTKSEHEPVEELVTESEPQSPIEIPKEVGKPSELAPESDKKTSTEKTTELPKESSDSSRPADSTARPMDSVTKLTPESDAEPSKESITELPMDLVTAPETGDGSKLDEMKKESTTELGMELGTKPSPVVHTTDGSTDDMAPHPIIESDTKTEQPSELPVGTTLKETHVTTPGVVIEGISEVTTEATKASDLLAETKPPKHLATEEEGEGTTSNDLLGTTEPSKLAPSEEQEVTVHKELFGSTESSKQTPAEATTPKVLFESTESHKAVPSEVEESTGFGELSKSTESPKQTASEGEESTTLGESPKSSEQTPAEATTPKVLFESTESPKIVPSEVEESTTFGELSKSTESPKQTPSEDVESTTLGELPKSTEPSKLGPSEVEESTLLGELPKSTESPKQAPSEGVESTTLGELPKSTESPKPIPSEPAEGIVLEELPKSTESPKIIPADAEESTTLEELTKTTESPKLAPSEAEDSTMLEESSKSTEPSKLVPEETTPKSTVPPKLASLDGEESTTLGELLKPTEAPKPASSEAEVNVMLGELPKSTESPLKTEESTTLRESPEPPKLSPSEDAESTMPEELGKSTESPKLAPSEAEESTTLGEQTKPTESPKPSSSEPEEGIIHEILPKSTESPKVSPSDATEESTTLGEILKSTESPKLSPSEAGDVTTRGSEEISKSTESPSDSIEVTTHAELSESTELMPETFKEHVESSTTIESLPEHSKEPSKETAESTEIPKETTESAKEITKEPAESTESAPAMPIKSTESTEPEPEMPKEPTESVPERRKKPTEISEASADSSTPKGLPELTPESITEFLDRTTIKHLLEEPATESPKEPSSELEATESSMLDVTEKEISRTTEKYGEEIPAEESTKLPSSELPTKEKEKDISAEKPEDELPHTTPLAGGEVSTEKTLSDTLEAEATTRKEAEKDILEEPSTSVQTKDELTTQGSIDFREGELGKVGEEKEATTSADHVTAEIMKLSTEMPLEHATHKLDVGVKPEEESMEPGQESDASKEVLEKPAEKKPELFEEQLTTTEQSREKETKDEQAGSMPPHDTELPQEVGVPDVQVFTTALPDSLDQKKPSIADRINEVETSTEEVESLEEKHTESAPKDVRTTTEPHSDKVSTISATETSHTEAPKEETTGKSSSPITPLATSEKVLGSDLVTEVTPASEAAEGKPAEEERKTTVKPSEAESSTISEIPQIGTEKGDSDKERPEISKPGLEEAPQISTSPSIEELTTRRAEELDEHDHTVRPSESMFTHQPEEHRRPSSEAETPLSEGPTRTASTHAPSSTESKVTEVSSIGQLSTEIPSFGTDLEHTEIASVEPEKASTEHPASTLMPLVPLEAVEHVKIPSVNATKEPPAAEGETVQEHTPSVHEPPSKPTTTQKTDDIKEPWTKAPADYLTPKPYLTEAPIVPSHPPPTYDNYGQTGPQNLSTAYTDEYTDEEDPTAFSPGTCRYGGKLYVSAQQIPRDDPCDFCFCFRSDIICLQQSCPPPINGCHEEPIQGFCCPRYECPVSMATVLNSTTTTTTTTLPPHFLHHAYNKAVPTKRGCQIQGNSFQVGEAIKSASGPCMHCVCGGDGQMKCDPKVCSPEPMLRQMIAIAASRKR